jgi:hypothetical protein
VADPIRKRYRRIGDLAAKERDPAKLIALVEELNRLLGKRNKELQAKQLRGSA